MVNMCWPAAYRTRRSLRCAPLGARASRTPHRSPAKPGAGPLKTDCVGVLAAARPPRQSLAFGSLGGTSAAEPPLRVIVRSAALQPLRQANWHIGRNAAPSPGRRQPVRQSSHRAPPTRPRRIARGTKAAVPLPLRSEAALLVPHGDRRMRGRHQLDGLAFSEGPTATNGSLGT